MFVQEIYTYTPKSVTTLHLSLIYRDITNILANFWREAKQYRSFINTNSASLDVPEAKWWHSIPVFPGLTIDLPHLPLSFPLPQRSTWEDNVSFSNFVFHPPQPPVVYFSPFSLVVVWVKKVVTFYMTDT